MAGVSCPDIVREKCLKTIYLPTYPASLELAPAQSTSILCCLPAQAAASLGETERGRVLVRGGAGTVAPSLEFRLRIHIPSFADLD